MERGAAPPRIGGRPSRRAFALGTAVALALATAGCASDVSRSGSAGAGAPLVTGAQVVTACFQDYFYNGILPRAAARANCTACVVGRLRTLGIRPSDGENVGDMLTGDRLSGSEIRSLENSCREADAGSQ